MKKSLRDSASAINIKCYKGILVLMAIMSITGLNSIAQTCQANFNYIADTSGTGVSFSDNSTGNITGWSWDFGDSTVVSGQQNPYHVYNSIGYYYVCLTVSDAGGCTNTYCSSVYTDTTSVCFALFNNTVDTTGLVYSFVDASSGSPSNWSWNFGDGNTSTTQNPTHTYSLSGNYYVCLTISDSATGCLNTVCSNITVLNANCFSSFTYTPDSLGAGVSFFDQSMSNAVGWLWDFGDSTTSIMQNPYHVYNNQGYYNVCLTVSDSNTCNITYCTLVVTDTSSLCNSNFTYIVDTSGLVYSFTDVSSGNPSNWSWNFGDGNTSNLQNPIHTFAPGNYNVCLTIMDSATNCANTACFSVNVVSSNCYASFFMYADSLNPNQYWVVNNSTGNNLLYFWDFGDSASTSTLAYPTHTYAQAGTYNICLTISDPGGCTSTYCQSLSFKTLGSSMTITVIPPTSINEEVNNIVIDFKAYPNPFRESVTFNYSLFHAADVSLEIFNMLGETVSQIEMENKSSGNHVLEWNAGILPDGIYFLKMQVENTILTKKIVLVK